MKSILPTVLLIGATASGVWAKDTYPPVQLLLQTETSVLGEPLQYPEGTPQITVAIVTMQPGQKTGLHRHEAPLTGYMLEGELTVDYGDAGIRTYNQGDALVEAFGSPHEGTNTGADIARVLVVFSGAEGTENTVSE